MSPRPADAMTSTGFVAYAIEVARTTDSWDEAERAFSGRPRWDTPVVDDDRCSTVEYEPEAGSHREPAAA